MVRAKAIAVGGQVSPSIPCDITDLESAGNFGLFEASRRYRPECGNFENFAKVFIWRYMMRHVDRMRVRRELPLANACRKSSAPSQEDVAIERERNACLESAIGKLPMRLRRFVNIVYGQDIRQRELARRWGITEGRVSHLNVAALSRLKALLDEGAPH